MKNSWPKERRRPVTDAGTWLTIFSGILSCRRSLQKKSAQSVRALYAALFFFLGLYIQHAQNPERVVQSAVFLVGDYFLGSVKTLRDAHSRSVP
jgi:hypothetical protein